MKNSVRISVLQTDLRSKKLCFCDRVGTDKIAEVVGTKESCEVWIPMPRLG